MFVDVFEIPVWLFLLCILIPCIVSGLIGFAIGKDIKKLKSSAPAVPDNKYTNCEENTATDFTLGEVLLTPRPQKPKNRENKGKNKSREVINNGRS